MLNHSFAFPNHAGFYTQREGAKHAPMIIVFRSCGRVKLPHFYCCRGALAIPDQQNNSHN
ncbi:BnaC06g30660D [Brassica napus]|uniref:Uncharacterized protein n=2 Tax=Brassica TaxID=3705 RepID=A0A3P6GUP4_BRAOL|nr:unnamed protein product [Brassica napus]CDY40928.1 BnaC06g30660D [Brassica napus]VDD63936.1 unnamed protein product [Brassica oleracea]